MSTATEECIAAQAESEAPKYRAPEVEIGQEVFWYKAGHLGNEPEICRVKEIEGNGSLLTLVSLSSRTAGIRPFVRHVTDPHLEEDRDWRQEWGCWEFTQKSRNDSQLRADVADLRKQLAAIRDLTARLEAVEELVAGSAKAKK